MNTIADHADVRVDACNRRSTRRTRVLALAGLLAVAGALAVAGTGGAAVTLRVCAQGCVYATLTDALAAAHDGDTIVIGAGTYAGSVAVGKNVQIIGSGP